jgi:hypothetical protein
MSRISEYSRPVEIQNGDQFIFARPLSADNFAPTMDDIRKLGFALTPIGDRASLLALNDAGQMVKFQENLLHAGTYKHSVLPDDPAVVWDADNKVVSSASIDTARVEMAINQTNINNGSSHTLYVRKQSASDLVLSFVALLYKVGYQSTDNVITLSGPANTLFKLEFTKMSGSVAMAVSLDVVSNGNRGDITVSGLTWTINNGAVTNDKITSVEWAKITNKPTTFVYTNGSYDNPSWITGLDWSKLQNVPSLGGGAGVGTLQEVTLLGNSTNIPIILRSPDTLSNVTISVGNDGKVIFTAGAGKNFYFSGDVVAFSNGEGGGVGGGGGGHVIASNLVAVAERPTLNFSTKFTVTDDAVNSATTIGLAALAISDTSGLQAALDGKSSTGHSHSISDVSGLQAALDGKAPVGHTHNVSDITGLTLQAVMTGGNTTTIPLIIKNTGATKQVTISVNTDGNIILDAGVDQNFHFSGDVVAFSSLTPPVASWWDLIPVATTTTLGGVKVDGTTITITGGVISAVAGAPISHTHIIADVTGLQAALDAKEPLIAAGTNAQYWRGDKSWQTLSTANVSEVTNLYFTEVRVRATALTGYSVGANTALAAGDSVLGAFQKVQGQLNAKQATLTNPVTGTGTTNYIPKFTGTSTIGNSIMQDSGTVVQFVNTNTFRILPNFSPATTGIPAGVLLDTLNAASITLMADATAGTAGKGVNISAYNSNNTTWYRGLAFNNKAGVPDLLLQPDGGNVGIGTSSPSSKLNVFVGNISGPTLGSPTAQSFSILGGSNAYGLVIGVSGTGDTWFQSQRVDTDTSVYNLILQPSAGNVGIGVSPSYKLDVNGLTRTAKYVTSGNNVINTADPNEADIVIGSNTYGTRHNSSVMFWSADSAARISLTGNVFSFSAWNSSTPNADINCGVLTALGEVTAFSDRRLKEDILDYSGGLNKILAMRPVTYKTIADKSEHIGLIAQEVQDIERLLVQEGDKYLSLNYQKITVLLINAVKELNEKLNQNK